MISKYLNSYQASEHWRKSRKSQSDTLCTVCFIVNHRQHHQKNGQNWPLQTLVTSLIIVVERKFKTTFCMIYNNHSKCETF